MKVIVINLNFLCFCPPLKFSTFKFSMVCPCTQCVYSLCLVKRVKILNELKGNACLFEATDVIVTKSTMEIYIIHLEYNSVVYRIIYDIC